jgi:hypothetical protein
MALIERGNLGVMRRCQPRQNRSRMESKPTAPFGRRGYHYILLANEDQVVVQWATKIIFEGDLQKLFLGES